MASVPVTNHACGEPESVTNKALEAGAAAAQSFAPTERICAHLNAFHAYVSEPTRFVEANHYCSHLNDEVRQCILYDSPEKGARLIGVEYMISPRLYSTLDPTEQRLWHSHVFEVKSGMLIMPKTPLIPDAVWEAAECKEMEEVIKLYGKVYHLWQTDRGDKLPLGEPNLMTSFTKDGQLPQFEEVVGDRDKRFGADWKRKKAVREYIKEPVLEGEADAAWRTSGKGA